MCDLEFALRLYLCTSLSQMAEGIFTDPPKLYLDIKMFWNLLLPTDAHNVKKHRVIKTF